MLQHTATPCNILQLRLEKAGVTVNAVSPGFIPDTGLSREQVCVCVWLQHTATHCNTLYYATTRCNMLQHTATHCDTLQYTVLSRDSCVFVYHCSTLQHTAAHCNTLQHTATHCNTLQYTATHCCSASCFLSISLSLSLSLSCFLALPLSLPGRTWQIFLKYFMQWPPFMPTHSFCFSLPPHMNSSFIDWLKHKKKSAMKKTKWTVSWWGLRLWQHTLSVSPSLPLWIACNIVRVGVWHSVLQCDTAT